MNLNTKHYEGKPCRRAGHVVRYVKSGKCVQCHSEYEKVKYLRNSPKIKAAVNAYRKANPDKIRRTRLRRYKLSTEQYEQLLDKQKGRCAICGSLDARTKRTSHWFFVDHDHATGKVRGLLCNHCNRGIGAFEDNVSSLENAILYLQRNEEGGVL